MEGDGPSENGPRPSRSTRTSKRPTHLLKNNNCMPQYQVKRSKLNAKVTISTDANSVDAVNSDSFKNSGSRLRPRSVKPVASYSPTVSEVDSSSDDEYAASSASSFDSDNCLYEPTKSSKRQLLQKNHSRHKPKNSDNIVTGKKGLPKPGRFSSNITSNREHDLPEPAFKNIANKSAPTFSDDNSSDSSSDEFLRVRPSDVLPVELTAECFQPKTEETVSGNDSLINGKNLGSGITGTALSGSESEVEYTQVNWPSIPGSSHMETVVDVAPVRNVEAPLVSKTSGRRRGKSKGGNAVKKECKDDEKPMDVLQLLMLGEGLSSDPHGVVSKYEPSEDDMSDLEEVSMDEEMTLEDNHPKQPAIPKEGVQITVEVPELAQRKKKKGFDVHAYLLRRLNNRKRSIQILIHKVHILAWIAHGRFVNSVLNSEILMGLSLSMIPSRHCYPPKRADLGYLEQFVAWFLKNFPLKQDVVATYPLDLLESLQSQFNVRSANSKRDLVLMFICFLRSLGIKARLVMSLQPAPLKLGSSDLCTVLPIKTETNAAKSPGTSGKMAVPRIKEIVRKEEDAKVESSERKRKRPIKEIELKDNTNAKSFKSKRKTAEKSKYFSADKKCKGDGDSKSKYFANNSNNSINKGEVDELNTSASQTKTARKMKSKPDNKSKYFEKADNAKEKNKQKQINSEGGQSTSGPSNKPTPTKRGKGKSSETTAVPNVAGGKKINEANRKVLPTRQSKMKVKVVSKIASDDSDFEPTPKLSRSSRRSCVSDAAAKSKTEKKSSGRNSSKSKRKLTVKAEIKSEDSNSDSEFEPEKEREYLPSSDSANDASEKSDHEELVIRKKPPKKWSGKLDRRVLSSDSSDAEVTTKKTKARRASKEGKQTTRKIGIDVWCEVYLESEEKWFCVDVPRKKVHCYSDLHAKATQPVLYVVGFNPDLSLKDVTRRYVINWSTIKQRVDETWWEKALKSFLGKQTPQDREEEEELSNQMLNHPLPTTIGEYKNHPLYALKRHLLKFEAIYPADAPTLGFVRGEGVYSRDCVMGLHSREVWVKQAKVVKPGEQPYKIVKARPKYDKMSGCMISDLPLEVFGIWQVGEYVPPTAENGKVPRNEYGNVELFKPCMLPKGTVHLPIPGLSRVARKLGIDCAPAMIGFDYHSGGSHPTYDGYVVCKEHKEIILDAWKQEMEESEKRAAEKLEKRVYDNWKRLIKGLLIRERLKERYAFGAHQPSTSKAKPTRGKNTGKKR